MPSSPTDISMLPTSPDDPRYAAIRRFLVSPDEHPDDKAHLFIEVCERDFWFFCRYATSARAFWCEFKDCEYYQRAIFDHPFIFDRCRAIQAEPNGFLDLSPRGHLKTTLITFYQTLWDFLHRPTELVAIVTWKIQDVGDAFVEGLRKEMEPAPLPENPFHPPADDAIPQVKNQMLAEYWPEIFWRNPAVEAPQAGKKWKYGHLELKQHPGLREASISMMGLNAMRTSKHFGKVIYDDIVVEESSYTPAACEDCTEKFQKTVGMWHTARETAIRAAGTRWAEKDTYKWILKEGILQQRIGPEDCYGDDGRSIFHPGSNWLDKWKVALGPTLFSANMRNRCIDASVTWRFQEDWLCWYTQSPEEIAEGANLYAHVDPARMGETRWQRTDFTSLIILALRPDGKRYVVDMYRNKFDLEEMIALVFGLDGLWRGRGNPIKYWWWESRGASLDIEFWKDKAAQKKNAAIEFLRFDENRKKDTRIARLIRPFELGEILLPRHGIFHDVEGTRSNIVNVFIQEEYRNWRPHERGNRNMYARNEDLLDCLAQTYSPDVKKMLEFPLEAAEETWEDVIARQDLARTQRKSKPKMAVNPWSC